ncbi:MAG: methylornithine synthase PylB, partial [Candidatus Adiutrix sp.]|nr:methylornithine synthase PylB [Candidatus Adiutrix sp.]
MNRPLTPILAKAAAGGPLDRDELIRLVPLAGAEERAELQAAARQARDSRGGGLIYTYGFVYLSTFCRNACRFCAFRRDSAQARRYRRTEAEVLAAALDLAGQGVNLIDLTLGEDPEADRPEFIQALAE